MYQQLSTNHRHETDESIIGIFIGAIILAFVWPDRHKLDSYWTELEIIGLSLVAGIIILSILILIRKKRRSKILNKNNLKPKLWDKMSG
jgi:tetrahydromethanopterin S-methyltransferase subunit E